MKTAPLNATWVLVKLADGREIEAHWAQDLSGEDQPCFSGWFTHGGRNYYNAIPNPVAWKPKPQNTQTEP